MVDNTNGNSEEVDLGQLFKLIGNGINTFFNKIGSLIKGIFHYIILTLIFLKKNFIVLALTTVLGGVLGYVLSVKSNADYYSDMILETNYGSAHELYKQADVVNTLIKNKDYKSVSKILNINENQAQSISEMEVEPYNAKENLLKEYDYFKQHTDTAFNKNITIEDFKARYDAPDYRFQKLRITGSDKDVFDKLNESIIKLIENNHFKNIKELKIKELENRKNILLKNLAYIDSLRSVYKKIDLLNAKKESTQATNNINLVDQPSKINKDLALFKESKSLLSALRGVDNDKIRNGFVVSQVSKFNVGEKPAKIRDSKWFKMAIAGFLLGLMLILIKKVNTYLNNYTL